jgi:WD40 repeat protein
VKSKVYAQNYLFSKMASTLNNSFVVGSKKGELRLYDQDVGKRAKTLFTGLGQEILGVDVSQDGNYIIATCPNYLMFIPTQIQGDKNGFTNQMGKGKPNPKKLTLANPDYVKLGVQNQQYTKATFNNGTTHHDTEIITSIGQYIVTWRLKDILKGRLGNY